MTGKRAVILTGHFPVQKRRGSILWLSDNLRDNGWHVTIITVGYSWVSKLRGDKRFQSLEAPPLPGETRHDETLTAVFGYAPLHPFSLRKPALDALLEPLHRIFPAYWRRRLPKYLADADLVVVESGQPVMLAPIARAAAPGAAMVYRVNDDVTVLGLPNFISLAEMRYASLFDRISVASPHLARRFERFGTVARDPMGVSKALLDRDMPDPFAGAPRATREAVCAGTTQFDMPSVLAIARLRPDWRFHIFGRLRGDAIDKPGNLVLHGERPFEETAAWVRHADIGLAPYLDKPGVEYQTVNSNRMLMYRYFGLPMIGPERLCDPEVPSLVGYRPGSEPSIRAALDRLEGMGRGPSDPSVQDWSVLYERIAATPKPDGTRYNTA
ncbi:hypothetical protein [Puniceibacterium sediminis]|uniref:2-beta-glucuronyltransferase n=1 Tax=Puniceibacterium sediminis TaxID=1608407 RepID=A0A238ZQL1_9RHOB|nr:hypothetical protein [Puniceibacterium sediminis]SNR85432.1 2-beta-glucuronyltransferase [Puniceibacterium sediminis]